MGREDYRSSIVKAHRIHYEAKAPDRQQSIAQTSASYAARNPELYQILGIRLWGHHIAPVRFNKLITATEFAEYLRSSKSTFGVKPLEHAWKKATFE